MVLRIKNADGGNFYTELSTDKLGFAVVERVAKYLGEI